MSQHRHYSARDQFCLGVDQVIRTLFGQATTTEREYPANALPESSLTDAQRKYSAQLMRVNHAGEVCAQALYQGQGCVSKRLDVKEKMRHAMLEEGDHLAWCHTRLLELGSHASYLNPLWYAGSFVLGVTAGLMGDKWSLGFLAETETQVVKHLEHHLALLPAEDKKSSVVLEQMREDEALHRQDAIDTGAAELPAWVKSLMRAMSNVMVGVTRYI